MEVDHDRTSLLMRNPGHLAPGCLIGGDIVPGIMTTRPASFRRETEVEAATGAFGCSGLGESTATVPLLRS